MRKGKCWQEENSELAKEVVIFTRRCGNPNRA